MKDTTLTKNSNNLRDKTVFFLKKLKENASNITQLLKVTEFTSHGHPLLQLDYQI